MDESTAREAREIIAASRAWLREWAEEGIDQYERPPAPTTPLARTETAPATSSPPGTDRARSSIGARPSERGVDPGARASAEPAARSASPAPSEPQPAPPGVSSGGGSDAEPAPAAPSSLGARPSLEEVREFLGECTRCGLCEGRSTIVFGDGNPDADLMFVGEGPGEQEDRQGLPFVGRAGELLTQMIERGIETPRRDVYICNIVKCRPPGNRDPLPDEVAACRPFLDGQIEAVRPKVIVTLGKPAASLLLGRNVAITRERGVWQQYRGIPLMPTFHPAYVLRQYTPENRRLVWEDLKAAVTRSREG